MKARIAGAIIGFAGFGLLTLSLVSQGRVPASGQGDPIFRITVPTAPESIEGPAWNFIDDIQDYQERTPSQVLDIFKSFRDVDLKNPVGVAFQQDIAASRGAKPKAAAVEMTKVMIPIPYAEFLERFPPAQWGTKLAHYLGGEVRVLSVDARLRPVRQIERMVLSSLPWNSSFFWLNQDMTKLEQIVYEQDRATVYWKVIFSNNGSTVMDLGSVQFSRLDAASVLITFHSAHRLRVLGMPIAPGVLAPSLKKTFLDHLKFYRAGLRFLSRT